MKSCIRKIMGMTFVLCLSVLFAGCGKEAVRLTAAGTGMGTVVQTTLYVEDEEQGKDTLYEIGRYVESYEAEVLSWRVENSELSQINQSAGATEGLEVSERMREYLHTIWEISAKSGGALDVTVGQVTEAWNLDEWAVAEAEKMHDFQVPTEEEINALLEHVGYEKVILKDDRIYLPEGMKLDLGAVGKGIVCDEIGEYINKQACVTGAVITVGGSVVTYGVKPDGSSWQVAVTHPREDGKYLGTLSLKGEYYVATSGDYERYVEKDGTRYHHIMNPATGYPTDNEVCSVTIVSKSGLVSDALSTACFVLGVEEGMALAEEFDAQALFVTKDLEVFMTEGMKDFFCLE